ncbi:MAG: outer membrane beta-barrel protein [bacterium]
MERRNEMIIIMCSIVFITIFIAFKASAQSKFKWDITPRLWYVDWDAGENLSDSTLMYGLGGSISYNKFAFGLSFLTGEFESEISGSGYDSYHGYYDYKINISADRSDIDVYASYRIIDPYLSLSLGYKIIEYDIKATESLYNEQVNADGEMTGFGLGASGAFPIRDKFYGYYIASYLPSMKSKYEDEEGSDEGHVNTFNLELGVGYMINEKITAGLGWKYQNLDWEEGEDEKLNGIILMANFGF